MIGLPHYLAVAAALFTIGVFGIFVNRKNVIVILMSIELILLAVNIILLLAGNFMEPSSIVLIFAPILFPVAMKLGIDPVHFGIIMVVNMEVGMCHPPVGLNLYVASGITKMGITELTVAVWPWLLSMLCFLMVVTYWPALSTWFPRMLGMM